MSNKRRKRRKPNVQKSVPKTYATQNLGMIDDFIFAMLPSKNSRFGTFAWLDKRTTAIVASQPTLSLESLCSSNPDKAQAFADCQSTALLALTDDFETVLGKYPKKRDFCALAEMLDKSADELMQCEDNELIEDEDDDYIEIAWRAEMLDDVGMCCGTYEHLHELLDDEDEEGLVAFLENTLVYRVIGEVTMLLSGLVTHLEDGHHHLTVLTLEEQAEVMQLDKTTTSVTLPVDMQTFFEALITAYTVGGSLLVRTVTGELHNDGVTQVTKICGYTLADEEVIPLDEAEIFTACNTDASTGDLLAPEHAVQYYTAWELG